MCNPQNNERQLVIERRQNEVIQLLHCIAIDLSFKIIDRARQLDDAQFLKIEPLFLAKQEGITQGSDNPHEEQEHEAKIPPSG